MLSVSSKDTPKVSKLPRLYAWGPLAAIVMVLLSFLFIPVLAQIQISFYPTLLGWDNARAEAWLLNSPAANFLYVLLTETLTIAVLYWFTAYKHISFRIATALGRPRWRDLWHAALGFLIYLGIFVIGLIIVDTLFPIDTDQEQALGFTRGIGGVELAMAFIGLVILPPIAEEIVFRGFFYGTLRANKVRKWSAIIVTSLIFGSFHLFGAAEGGLLWIAFVDTVILSVVLCYFREQNGTIWASIGIHALKNGFVFLNLFVINAT